MILKLYLIINILTIGFTLSIKPSDFCFLKLEIHQQVVCKKQQCGYDLCSKDEHSCKSLNDWYMLINNYNSYLNTKDPNKYIKLIQNIKECKPNEYITLNKNVCSIKNNCEFYEQYKLRQLFKAVTLKYKQCLCSGKLSFKCGNYYCTYNKQTCSKLINFLNDSTYLKQIKKC